MMKQSKRLLSVLLALIMMCSVFTVGAQAMKTSYEKPDGYDSVLDPIINTEQAATMLLDYIDAEVFKKSLIDFEKLDIEIHIDSVDGTLDSLRSLHKSNWLGVAEFMVSLGDIEKLNLSAGDDTSIRRRSTSCTDMAVLMKVLSFLESNSYYISKFVDNSFNFGALKSLGVIDPQTDLAILNDLHGTITAKVYDMIYGDGASTAEGTAYSAATPLDDILQELIDNNLVKMIVDMCASKDGTNEVGELLGFTTYEKAGDSSDLDELGKLRHNVPTTQIFPSLTPSTEPGDGKLGYLSFKNDTTYDFFLKIIKALIQDIVIPYAGPLLADAIGEEGASYIDVVVEFLKLDVTFPEGSTTSERIDILLKYLLVDGGIEQFIYFDKTYKEDGSINTSVLKLADGLWEELCGLIRTVLPLLPAFWPDAPKVDKTDAELAAMGNEEFITYVLQVFLEKFVDGVDFATDCKTIKELASRTLIEVAAELIPSIDFEQQFETGQLTYDSDDCLVVAASVIQYYLNGETTIENHEVQPSFVSMLDTAVDWALGKYGALFGYIPENYAGADKTVWNKLYDTVFQWIPLTFLQGIEDSPAGVEALVKDKLLNSVLDFDIENLLSIFGRRQDSELMKPVPELIVDLLARIVNPLFRLPTERESDSNGIDQKTLIIPYNYKTLDQFITVINSTSDSINGTGLKNTVYVLLNNLSKLHEDSSSFLYQALPLAAQLMGLWSNDDYPFVKSEAPGDYPIVSAKTFCEIYERYAESSNDGLDYDDARYSFFHMVDFKPFLYLSFRRARVAARDVYEQYKASLVNPAVVAPTRTEMTNAAYVLETNARMLEQGYNMDGSVAANENDYQYYGETTANNYQLNKTLNKTIAANYSQTVNDDGTKTYTDRSWAAYEKAYAFAVKVNNEYKAATSSDDSALALRNLRQSRINTARKMLIKATKELKAYIPLADYTNLDISIDVIQYITSLRKFDKNAVKELVDAYLNAINLDRDYDQDEQLRIDKCQEALDEAASNLDVNLVDYLELYNDGAGQYIDENKGFVFGLEEGFASAQALEEVGDFDTYMLSYYGNGVSIEEGAYALGIDSTANGNGTGAVIKMYSYEDPEQTTPKGPSYKVVIFGDVDGDAYADGCDSVLIRAYNAMLLNDSQFGDAALYAADMDVNESVDINDAKTCEKAGLLKTTVNQTPDIRVAQTYGILDILGLR